MDMSAGIGKFVHSYSIAAGEIDGGAPYETLATRMAQGPFALCARRAHDDVERPAGGEWPRELATPEADVAAVLRATKRIGQIREQRELSVHAWNVDRSVIFSR